MIKMVLLSAIAGIFGTGLGGLTSALLMKRSSVNIVCGMLSIAAGIMTSIVCFGLIPEALHLSDITISIFGLVLGAFIIMVLNRLVDKITETNESNLKIHHTYEELYHENQFIKNKAKIMRSGIIILIAISLHNIPEGIAIGAGGSHDLHFGFLLSIMIAIHNIPEGMAVASPLLFGGIDRWKAVFLTALSGVPTLLGGIIGILFGNVSDIAIAISLSSAGGAMLYVVFGEIMPQSIVMTKSRAASIMILFGMIIGLIVTQIKE
jgi:ZIP family zinc transporter